MSPPTAWYSKLDYAIEREASRQEAIPTQALMIDYMEAIHQPRVRSADYRARVAFWRCIRAQLLRAKMSGRVR